MDDQSNEKFRKAISDDDSLQAFLLQMSKFSRLFCELMYGNADFTIRLEVHGNERKMLHARVSTDDIWRSPQSGKNKKKK